MSDEREWICYPDYIGHTTVRACSPDEPLGHDPVYCGWLDMWAHNNAVRLAMTTAYSVERWESDLKRAQKHPQRDEILAACERSAEPIAYLVVRYLGPPSSVVVPDETSEQP